MTTTPKHRSTSRVARRTSHPFDRRARSGLDRGWIPLLLGSIAGAIPVSLFGKAEPVGLVGLFTWGVCGSAIFAILWMHGPVFESVAEPFDHGIHTYLHVSGVPQRRVIARGLLVAIRSTAWSLGLAGAASVVSGAATTCYGGRITLGAARGPDLHLFFTGTVAVLVTIAFATALAVATPRADIARHIWRATIALLATVALSSIWFAPAAHLIPLLPLAAIWPINQHTEGGVLAALTLTPAIRAVNAVCWVVLVVVSAVHGRKRRGLVPGGVTRA